MQNLIWKFENHAGKLNPEKKNERTNVWPGAPHISRGHDVVGEMYPILRSRGGHKP